MPEQILGKDVAARLKSKKPDAWYPVAEIIDPLEELGRKLGTDSLRKVGITIFNGGPAEVVRKVISSARELAYGFDRLYRTTNRGLEIGSWTVVEFKPGKPCSRRRPPIIASWKRASSTPPSEPSTRPRRCTRVPVSAPARTAAGTSSRRTSSITDGRG